MPLSHHRHLLRALLLLLGALLLFFVVRTFLTPHSFGQYGHFRGDNLKEQAAIALVHGSPSSCGECHQDQVGIVSKGPHIKIPCQDCHGPLGKHVTEEGIQPMPITKSFALCARCHQKLEARPKTFPQINLQEHVLSKGKNLESEEICSSCHRPHNPMKMP